MVRPPVLVLCAMVVAVLCCGAAGQPQINLTWTSYSMPSPGLRGAACMSARPPPYNGMSTKLHVTGGYDSAVDNEEYDFNFDGTITSAARAGNFVPVEGHAFVRVYSPNASDPVLYDNLFGGRTSSGDSAGIWYTNSGSWQSWNFTDDPTYPLLLGMMWNFTYASFLYSNDNFGTRMIGTAYGGWLGDGTGNGTVVNSFYLTYGRCRTASMIHRCVDLVNVPAPWPNPRQGVALSGLNATDNVLIALGGKEWSSSNTVYNDVWVSTNAWVNMALTTGSFSPRWNAQVFDAGRQSLILIGGLNGAGDVLNDVWYGDFTNVNIPSWTFIPSANVAGSIPTFIPGCTGVQWADESSLYLFWIGTKTDGRGNAEPYPRTSFYIASVTFNSGDYTPSFQLADEQVRANHTQSDETTAYDNQDSPPPRLPTPPAPSPPPAIPDKFRRARRERTADSRTEAEEA